MQNTATRWFVARAVLAVMMATFLSPSFAWHMHADHHEIVADTQPDHGHEGDDHHHDPAAGDHSEAHASIGHLLGHLAMHSPLFVSAAPVLGRVAPTVDVPAMPIVSETSPPYRPPLPIRLA